MKSRVAVVTGGTKGIGFGIAQRLAERGCPVAAIYHADKRAAAEAESKLRNIAESAAGILVIKGDAGDPINVAENYRRIKRELGSASILVNNAGIMPKNTFENISVKQWDETIQINLSGAFYWSSQVVPDMKAAGFGRIINISSLAARGGGVVGPHYAASKAGLLGLTRYSAKELGPYGITVNAIAPAFIEDAGIFTTWSPTQLDTLKQQVAVSRIGAVQDVVRAFEYLLESPFVTGVTLDVNGGTFMI